MKFLHLIWGALMRRKARTAFTLLSVVAAFLLFGLLESVGSAFTQVGQSIGAAHRLITAAKTGLMTPLPVSLERQIHTVPGVQVVTSETFFGGTYQKPSNFINVLAVGRNFWHLNTSMRLSAGARRAFAQTQTGVIVGAALARRFHWKVGDQIPIKAMIYPRKGGSYTWTFDIVGMFRDRMTLREQVMFFRWRYFDEAAQFGRGTVGWYVEQIGEPKQAGRIAQTIDALSSNSGHETRTQTSSAFAADFYSQYVDLGLIVHAIMGAVFFTLMLLTGNTMAQAVRERTPELAVLKTLGFSNRAVLSLVLAESVLLVLLGGALGLLLAGATVHVLQGQMGSQLPMLPVAGAIWLRGAIAMVAIGLVVGALPARRGMRLSIVNALAGR
ncbi:MAG: ABC transporter permease [Solirubrobacteraceae bacterium]|jgi:putative ABC transport system permease protein